LKVSIGGSDENLIGVGFSDGQWHHIAVCWRGSDGQIVAYQDGAQMYQGVFATGESIHSGGSLVIGQDQSLPGDTSSPTQTFAGEMANLRIYRRLLSPSEVEQVRLADVVQVQLIAPSSSEGMQLFSPSEAEQIQLVDAASTESVQLFSPSEAEQVQLVDAASTEGVQLFSPSAEVERIQLVAPSSSEGIQLFSPEQLLDFQLLDENNNNAVYIANHDERLNLYLQVTNVSSQGLVLAPQDKVQPGEGNSHFELEFHPGVLTEISLDSLGADSAGWTLASATDSDGSLRIFLLSQTERTIDPGKNLLVGMSYASAASPGSDRSTQVEMKYNLLHFAGEQTPLSGSQSSPLQVIDLRGQINIPLHLGFAGSDTVLNLGAQYPNTLILELSNASMGKSLAFQPEEGSEAVTRLILSTDVQPPEQNRDWALGTLSEVMALVPDIDDARWKKAVNEQGETPEWIFTPTELVQLQPGEMLRLTLNNIISSLPSGSANLYLRYEHIPGYRNGQFVLPVKKSPDSIKDLPLSGGGTVTWSGPDGRLRWSQRFIAASRENPSAYGGGYVEIAMPTGDIPASHVYDQQSRPLTADGILLKEWEALYAVHDTGKGSSALSFHIVNHTQQPFQAAGNWRLIAMVNPDDHSLKLGTGVTLSLGSSSSGGSPIPVGTITMWSGQIDRIPAGWALCNGQNGTPNLQDRFIVGAGSTYPVNASGGANTITLNPNEMPLHTHAASSDGQGDHFHWIEGINADGLSWRQRYYPGDTTVDMGYGGGSNADPNEVRWRGRVNSDPFGNHSHAITVAAAGGSQPHENRPPYFALAFIMKL
jgi:Concanavalin A-like lectin/glucanases superfamily